MPRTARKQGKTGVYYITLHNSKSHTENRPLYDMIFSEKIVKLKKAKNNKTDSAPKLRLWGRFFIGIRYIIQLNCPEKVILY